MSLIAQKISGCYRRVLIFFFVILIAGIGIGLFVYNRVGGAEGMRYWMAIRALNGTEKLLIANRPDGVPQETVEEQFDNVRDAIHNRQIDLKPLYELLNSYQTKFHNPGLSTEKIKPSTPEVEAFLTELRKTIFLDE
ncbi:hypothetical protein J4G08_07850 [Candidatus Poribacteria bacterium]|nr:hypothetical protein [Candidatus Poribacteria bacterium]